MGSRPIFYLGAVTSIAALASSIVGCAFLIGLKQEDDPIYYPDAEDCSDVDAIGDGEVDGRSDAAPAESD